MEQTHKQTNIHTSIVSRHLATRGNNKIQHTHPPHISSSEEILLRLTCCIFAQLRTNKSPFLKSYLHKVNTKTHPSPLCPLCNTNIQTHIISSTAPTYTPHCHPWICGQTPPELLHWWPDARRSWLVDHKPEDRTPPLARVMGVGRRHQCPRGPICIRCLMFSL